MIENFEKFQKIKDHKSSSKTKMTSFKLNCYLAIISPTESEIIQAARKKLARLDHRAPPPTQNLTALWHTNLQNVSLDYCSK